MNIASWNTAAKAMVSSTNAAGLYCSKGKYRRLDIVEVKADSTLGQGQAKCLLDPDLVCSRQSLTQRKAELGHALR